MAMPYTPHGSDADSAVSALLSKAFAALKNRRLLPVESLAHYVIDDYGRGEGWVVQEETTWVPYDTPHLFVLMPEGFEDEAASIHAKIQAQLEEICQEAGYSLRIHVMTADSLLQDPPLAFALASSRHLEWSFGGFDPLSQFKGVGAETLAEHAVSAMLSLERPLQELDRMISQERWGIHQGIVRLAFIRAVEVISGLGDVSLMKLGRYRSHLADRKNNLLDLAEHEQIHPQFAGLYAAAIGLRLQQSHPRIPVWNDLRTLISEIMGWARYLAETQFAAPRV